MALAKTKPQPMFHFVSLIRHTKSEWVREARTREMDTEMERGAYKRERAMSGYAQMINNNVTESSSTSMKNFSHAANSWKTILSRSHTAQKLTESLVGIVVAVTIAVFATDYDEKSDEMSSTASPITHKISNQAVYSRVKYIYRVPNAPRAIEE